MNAHHLPYASRISRIRLLSGAPDRTVVEKCTAKIKDAIPVTELEINGAYDDPNGSHITIYAVSEAFEGKRSLARQQMVFKAIWEEMQGLLLYLTRMRRACMYL